MCISLSKLVVGFQILMYVFINNCGVFCLAISQSEKKVYDKLLTNCNECFSSRPWKKNNMFVFKTTISGLARVKL